MTWLAILGLGAWVFILAMRVGDLKRDLQAMQARLREQAAPRPQTGLLANPIGAWWRPAVAGPPILDSLLVGFLGPAVLLAAATLPRVAVRRMLLLTYAAGAGAFALAWQALEVRRLFHGRELHAGLDALGRAESAAYALIFLAAAAATLWMAGLVRRRRLHLSPIAPEILLVGRFGSSAALFVALLVLGYLASPWWGPILRPLAGPMDAALLFGLYAAGCAGVVAVRLAADGVEEAALSRAARFVAVAVVFAFLNLVVRLAFRGLDMAPDNREAGLETWAFSAVWALYGFGLLVYGAARRSNDLRGAGLAVLLVALAKIFLFDMSRLDGVVRAGSFLAVGALLLAAAVLVRRLGGSALPFMAKEKAGEPDA